MTGEKHHNEPANDGPREAQLIWPPRAGGPTDDDLKRKAAETAASDEADFALSILIDAYFDGFSVDPEAAHQTFWEHVHLMVAMGIPIDDDQAETWKAFGYHAQITDTGVLVMTERGLVLRRSDGGEWLLPGVTAADGQKATVSGTRTGFDVLSDATIS